MGKKSIALIVIVLAVLGAAVGAGLYFLYIFFDGMYKEYIKKIELAERKILQEASTRRSKILPNDDSMYGQYNLEELSNYMIDMFNSYRDFISQNQDEYPNLTDGDRIFLYPDMYDESVCAYTCPEAVAKRDARGTWSRREWIETSRETYGSLMQGGPRVWGDLENLLINVAKNRILTITEDKTNIPENINFEEIFYPDLFDIIYLSDEDFSNTGLYPSKENEDDLLSPYDCLLNDDSLISRLCVIT